MREILFRGFHPNENRTTTITLDGKRIKGEWVFGFYWKRGEFAHYIKVIDEIGVGDYEVIPETVGQYTGLTDKNGNKIFEGDIVAFTVFDWNDNDKQYQGVIKWSDTENQATRFLIWHDNESEYYGADGAFDLDWVHYQDCEFEIIGNIYENAELLEVDNI